MLSYEEHKFINPRLPISYVFTVDMSRGVLCILCFRDTCRENIDHSDRIISNQDYMMFSRLSGMNVYLGI